MSSPQSGALLFSELAESKATLSPTSPTSPRDTDRLIPSPTPTPSPTPSPTPPAPPQGPYRRFRWARAARRAAIFVVSPTAKSYLKPQRDPQTGLTSARLMTTKGQLKDLRHSGFLQGTTLTSKLVYELGQVKKRNFIDQKFDITGKPTKSRMDLADDQNQMVSLAQDLLDILGKIERFVNHPEGARHEVREALAAAYGEYKTKITELSTNGSAHAEMVRNFSQNRSKEATLENFSMDARGANSLGEFIREESRELLAALQSHNYSFVQSRPYILPGFVGECVKKAVNQNKNYDFSLSMVPEFQHDLLVAESAPQEEQQEGIVVELKDYMPEEKAFDRTELLTMQRYLTSKNEARNNQEQPPQRLSALASVPFNPSLLKQRLSDVNSPSNKRGRLSFLGFKVLDGLALILDNVAGALLGIVGQNYTSRVRALVDSWQFKNKPGQGSPTNMTSDAVKAEEREHSLRLQVQRPPLFNKVFKNIFKLATQLVVGVPVYFFLALAQEASRVVVENVFARALSRRFLPRDKPGTVLRNILTKFMASEGSSDSQPPANSGRQVAPLDLSSDPPGNLDQEAQWEASELISLDKPLDFYQKTDLLGMAADSVKKTSLDLHAFGMEHPLVATLMAVTLSLAALPTLAKGGLHVLTEAMDASIKVATEKMLSIFPDGVGRDVVQKFLEGYLGSKVHLETLSGIANFDSLAVLDYLKEFQGKVSSDTLGLAKEMLKEKGAKYREDLFDNPLGSGMDHAGALGNEDGEDEAAQEFQPLPASRNKPNLTSEQELMIKLSLSFDQLPNLSVTEKIALRRAVLEVFPENTAFTDAIIRQCNKTPLVAVFGWTVPSSPLSVSLVHGVQHAFNALRMVLSIPLIPFRLAYNAWKKESNTSYRDFFSTTKMLLTESLAKVLSASATVLSAVALVVLLPLKVIVGGVDQVVSRFLPKAINPSAQRRARWAAGVDNFISRAGARLSKAFGLRTLQEKTQGQQGVKGLANDFISREVPASDAASSTPIGPEEKAQRMAEVVGGARVAQRLVAQAGRTEDASGPASEGGGDLVLPVTAGRTQDASGPASEGGGIEMVSRTSDLVLPVTPMLPADGLEMVSPTSPRSATVMFASLNLTGLTSGGSPSSSPRATTPTLPGSVPDDADAPGSGSPR